MVLLDPGMPDQERAETKRKGYPCPNCGGAITPLEIREMMAWVRTMGPDRLSRPTNCQNCGQVVAVWDEHAKYKEEIDGKVTLGWSC